MVTEAEEDQVVDSIEEVTDEEDLVEEAMEEEMISQEHLAVKENHFLMIDQRRSLVTIDHNQIQDMLRRLQQTDLETEKLDSKESMFFLLKARGK
jgi:hypothetical protein